MMSKQQKLPTGGLTNHNNNIIVFGFSGCGKSTLADALGEHYDLRVVHPSSILRDVCEHREPDLRNTKANQGFWESEAGVKLFQERLTWEKIPDEIADAILLSILKDGNTVMDSWSMPWLCQSDHGIKMFLKASLETRAARVAQRSGIGSSEAIKIVSMKDEQTRQLFKRLYGFDIQQDHAVFDITIDTDEISQHEVFQKVVDILKHKK